MKRPRPRSDCARSLERANVGAHTPPGRYAHALVTSLATLQSGPIYAIVSADSACGSFIHNLLHETVDAASDPCPPPPVIL